MLHRLLKIADEYETESLLKGAELTCLQRSWHELVAELDLLVRMGNIATTRARLKQLNVKSVPREFRCDLANVARRVGLNSIALCLLNSIVRSEFPLNDPPTNKELASYAASLAAIGALAEAFFILEPLVKQKDPHVLLHLAFLHMYRWEYLEVTPLLRVYLAAKNLTPYQEVVGQLNLCAALISNRETGEARTVLRSLHAVATSGTWNLIARDARILECQAFIHEKNWVEAEASLINAASLTNEYGLETILVQKWRAILDLNRFGPRRCELEKIRRLKAHAHKACDWETLRESDAYLAIATCDKRLADHVYIGTPFAAYRSKFAQLAGDWWQAPRFCTLQDSENTINPRTESTAPPISLNLAEDTFLGQNAQSKSVLLQTTLRALVRDFYRPRSVGSLFSEIYPGEVFSPMNSPNRIKRLIARLRELVLANRIPLEIKSSNGCYYWNVTQRLELIVPVSYGLVEARNALADKQELSLESLKLKWSSRAFSSSQAAAHLQVSRSEALEILKSGIKTGRVYRIGERRTTQFKFGRPSRMRKEAA